MGIQFKDIKSNIDISHAVVIVGLAVKEDGYNAEDIKDTIISMNFFFTEEELFKNDIKIIDLIKIDGNVEGENGRHDYIMKLSKSIENIDSIARAESFTDIKWCDDFLENYKNDYIA